MWCVGPRPVKVVVFLLTILIIDLLFLFVIVVIVVKYKPLSVYIKLGYLPNLKELSDVISNDVVTSL